MRAVAFGTIHVRMIVSLVYRVARKLLRSRRCYYGGTRRRTQNCLCCGTGFSDERRAGVGFDRRWQVWSGVVVGLE